MTTVTIIAAAHLSCLALFCALAWYESRQARAEIAKEERERRIKAISSRYRGFL